MNSLFIETNPDGHVKIVYGVERVRDLEQKQTKHIKKVKKHKTKNKRK